MDRRLAGQSPAFPLGELPGDWPPVQARIDLKPVTLRTKKPPGPCAQLGVDLGRYGCSGWCGNGNSSSWPVPAGMVSTSVTIPSVNRTEVPITSATPDLIAILPKATWVTTVALLAGCVRAIGVRSPQRPASTAELSLRREGLSLRREGLALRKEGPSRCLKYKIKCYGGETEWNLSLENQLKGES